MWHTDRLFWSRLDNAAKIFAPTSDQRDTRVFRFACELTQEVEPDTLQSAVERALEDFPQFRCVMRRGFFWNYLEQSKLRPLVTEENGSVCGPIYDKSRLSLLFRVTYYKKRINLEMYHVLSDGTGALQFLKAIISHYLSIETGENYGVLSDYDATLSAKFADSFNKYYDKNQKAKQQRKKNAYHLKGSIDPENRLSVIEGVVSSKALSALAKRYHVSVTAFMAAVLIFAIREDMPVNSLKKPVVISIPVNLRKYFKSETARNFFGMMNVSYDFRKGSGEFSDILNTVSQTFRRELTRERLSIRMNKLIAVEHNFFIRIPPLPIKNFVLKIARYLSDLKVTAVISNIGIVNMPPEFSQHIRLFDFFIRTKKTQLCMCSYNDQLMLSFSSIFRETDLQMHVFRKLSELGLDICIYSNRFSTQQEGDSNAILPKM